MPGLATRRLTLGAYPEKTRCYDGTVNPSQQLLLALFTPTATLAVIMIGFLSNNSRMSDLKTDINARLAEFQAGMREQQRAQGEAYDAKLARLEEIMLHKFSELDNRLIRIEHKHGG